MKKEALLRELAKLTAENELRPDEFTGAEFHKECVKDKPNATVDSSRHMLNRLVHNGKIKVRKVRINGKECNAYSAK